MERHWEQVHRRKLKEFRAKRAGASDQIRAFRDLIRYFYRYQQREFIWRDRPTAYNVFVSEIMLQQTQTNRVQKKFPLFVKRFPGFQTLARARLRTVLQLWQGLGYNRRALALQESAKRIVRDWKGEMPDCPDALMKLPGVGIYTANAICAFVFNRPTVFVETNIRSVFLHFFFTKRSEVHDKEILPLIDQCLDRRNPRQWYYALMDYGAYLKSMGVRNNAASVHYTRQSRFEGSNRQLRGRLLRELILVSGMSEHEASIVLGISRERTERIIAELSADGLLFRTSKGLRIR